MGLKCFLLMLLIVLAPIESLGKTLRVGVLDSGLDLKDPRFKKILCADGHKDFTGFGILDSNGHGTHVVGLIQRYAEDADYCLVIYKYYHPNGQKTDFVEAIKYAMSDNIDVLNVSGGGAVFDKMEYDAIKSHPHIRVVAAAGNEGKDLEDQPYFPAAYPLNNILAVGNGETAQLKSSTSNFGDRVLFWEDGQSVESFRPLWKCGDYTRKGVENCKAKLSGTSMSCAKFTGKFIRAHATNYR